jgi:hypothetical protein
MERCDQCGVEYSHRMCTCAMHCPETCEPACCPPMRRCDCWCHHRAGSHKYGVVLGRA